MIRAQRSFACRPVNLGIMLAINPFPYAPKNMHNAIQNFACEVSV